MLGQNDAIDPIRGSTLHLRWYLTPIQVASWLEENDVGAPSPCLINNAAHPSA
jgi:hypothetical protein